MTNGEKAWILKYIRDRRQEQREDNQAIYAMGVDYHMVRKKIAKYLKDRSRKLNKSFTTFDDDGIKFYKDLLATGIDPRTPRRWLAKYEGIKNYIWYK